MSQFRHFTGDAVFFDYSKYEKLLLPQDVANTFAKIKVFQGKKGPFSGDESAIKGFKPLKTLRDTVRIQSAAASSRIEGIYTSESALEAAVKNNIEPRTHDEQEVRGLLDLLKMIEDHFFQIVPKPNLILQLHRDLYKYSPRGIGGRYKSVDNVIEETRDGQKFVRFKPLSTFETPGAMESLCEEFNRALDYGAVDSLLMIPIFILDILCIHPFSDGNGRLSRAITTLLMLREGYMIGLYSSIEAQIEKTKDDYYIALGQSSDKWHDGKNDVVPFVKYFLNIVYAAYKDFESKMSDGKVTKQEQIRVLFDETFKKLSKADIKQALPLISEPTIEITLKTLVESGYIIKEGSTRNALYYRNREDD